ncbi:hypothetical protein BDV37DRAFT_259955 [Aspergillus pseudonomiae]|uniref:Uncharacterized protein n=1 Tax=Aspergillus pseudonomiae TaxID=1506151 RepID=A0A5N7D137_9EURO|nr:uncharacterized protein BDV37DRAFT_259955 [Aspergillus pseudonomiae]KAE8399583.1 hypothetical protein BDV37DRAFT_259955 [Aspergillus pseudonomiae]
MLLGSILIDDSPAERLKLSIGGLSPTEHVRLNHFVAAAVDPEIAARYFISKRMGIQDVEIKRSGG